MSEVKKKDKSCLGGREVERRWWGNNRGEENSVLHFHKVTVTQQYDMMPKGSSV